MSKENTLSEYAVSVSSTAGGSKYHFNLMNGVGSPDNYTDLLNVLRTSTESDEINIHINCYGGYLKTAAQLVHNMKLCKGTLIAHLEGECHSSATLIFLACDSWVVHDHVTALFHQYTGGVVGEGHKMRASLAATDVWIDGLCREYYTNFLTEEEIQRLNEGIDFYLTSDDIIERLEQYNEARAEKVEKHEKEEAEYLYEQAKLIIASKEKGDDSSNSRKTKKRPKK